MTKWHRIFGVSLANVLTDLPFEVLQELELSQTVQRLDVAIVRKKDISSVPSNWPTLPDGLIDLADHNLVTYKSIQESLPLVSLLELITYSVSYAKQNWRNEWESMFERSGSVQLIAVSTLRPQWLRPEQNAHERQLLPGVYEVDGFGLTIRIIVPREAELISRNALWHLLSGDPVRVRFGMEDYQHRDLLLYNIIRELKMHYHLEGIEMPYTIDDYRREVKEEWKQELKPELKDEIIRELTAEERLMGLPVEERLKGLPVEERLKGLPVEVIEAYLQRLRQSNPASPTNSTDSDPACGN